MSGRISHTTGRGRSIIGRRHRSTGTGEAGGTTANCRSSLLCAGNSSIGQNVTHSGIGQG